MPGPGAVSGAPRAVSLSPPPLPPPRGPEGRPGRARLAGCSGRSGVSLSGTRRNASPSAPSSAVSARSRGGGDDTGGTRCRPWGLPAERSRLPPERPPRSGGGPRSTPRPGGSPPGWRGSGPQGCGPCARPGTPKCSRRPPRRARVPAGLSPGAGRESARRPLSPKGLELGLPGCSCGQVVVLL